MSLLFNLPYELTLAIFKEWLDDLKAISALDVAFCNKSQRRALLDLISDDRDPTVPLDQFTESGWSEEVFEKLAARWLSHYVAYLQWSQTRNRPERRLFVNSFNLDQVIHKPASMFPILQLSVESLFYLATASLHSGGDFQAISRLLGCCPHLTDINIFGSHMGGVDFDYGIIKALTTLPNIPLKAFRATDNCLVTELGVCMLAQTFGKTLEELRLGSANLSDEAILMIAKKCKRLQIVELNCNSISLKALIRLGDACKKIWFLSMWNFAFDDAALKELQSHFESLEVLRSFDSPLLTTMAFLQVLRAFPQIAVAEVGGIVLFKCVDIPASLSGDAIVSSSVTLQSLAASNIRHSMIHGRFILNNGLEGGPNGLLVLSDILDALPAEHIHIISLGDPNEDVVFPSPLLPKIGDKFGRYLASLELLFEDDMRPEDINNMLTKCPNLTNVSFYNCHALIDSSLEVMGKACSALALLQFQHAPLITDKGMAALLAETRQLSTLIIAGAEFIGMGTLNALLDFNISLKNLMLVRTKVKTSMMQKFKEKLTAQDRPIPEGCRFEE